MPRQTAAQKAAQAPADPLADLRDPDDATRYPAETTQEPAGATEGAEEPHPLAQLLGEAVGAASMCWDPEPAGVFASERAAAIVDDLVAALNQAPTEAADPDEAVERWHRDTVAVGFLHKGGRCGCNYLARVVLGLG